VEDIEAAIAAAETELAGLEQALASPELYRDGDKVKQTTKAFEDTKAQLAQLYEHWEEAVELN
jgi:ATP-binding cassette subfamily F protein 3